VNPTANWNHKVSKTKEEYLYQYTAKNLYRLKCPVSSQHDLETRAEGKSVQYISLLPLAASTKIPPVRTEQRGSSTYTTYTTSNPAAFWQRP